MSQPVFTLQWPRDATRVAPLPWGASVRVEGAALQWQGEVIAAGECFVALPSEAGVQPLLQQLSWLSGDCSLLGQSQCLLCPDAGETTLSLQAPSALGECHGILANPRGAAVQARAAWGRVLSKYDAFLAANFDSAGPADRRVLLSWCDIEVQTHSEALRLSAEHIVSFTATPEHLVWQCFAQGHAFSISLALSSEGNAISLRCQMHSVAPADLRLRVLPWLEDRSFHQITQAFTGPEQSFPASLQAAAQGFRFALQGEHCLEVLATAPFQPKPRWQYCVPLPHCAARGLDVQTDVFCPGSFVWQPAEQRHFTLTASVDGDAPPILTEETSLAAPPRLPLPQLMAQALDLYLAQRDGELTVIAGFPWFLDWGRDSLIFVRGLIAAGHISQAASIVRRFAAFEQHGTLPNLLRGSEVTNRETSDAPLWLVIGIGELAEAGVDVCAADPRGGRSLLAVAQAIAEAKQQAQMDASSGLLHSPVHHTWMDTDRPACTPREGYPIEIQALWAAALQTLARLADDAASAALAARVIDSIERLYWREAEGFYTDCIHATAGTPAQQAKPDQALRPNQWLGITLGILTHRERTRRVLEASQVLLVPGAARSLAPHSLVGDAATPSYQGRYTGPEDSARKPAYHNGTAWGWQYPLYAEALALVHGQAGRQAARQLLSASASLLQNGCLGHLPEITDGDQPHAPRGCGAQAWSVSEWVRVWQRLELNPSPC